MPIIIALCLLLSAASALAQGVPNVPQVPGTLLSGPNAPEMGRLAVIAYHGEMLITLPEVPGGPPGDWQVRAWNIADPTNPQQVPITPITGDSDGDSLLTQHGFMAHGFIKTGNTLSSGRTFTVDGGGQVRETGNINFRMLGWTHGGMSVPWGATNYWSYGDTDQPAELYLNLPYGATPDAVFDPVGQTGVIGHPFIFGTTLYYASEQSNSGIASYDISDPSNPVLLDVLTQGGIGGYWPDPFGLNGRLYFFFPHDNPEGGFQVVDATDPTDLRLVASVPLEGNLNYAQFQDEFAFSERYKIDMRTFEVVLTLDEEANNRPGDPIDTGQFQLPIGNLLVTGGIYIPGSCNVTGFSSNHCGTGMSIWAHQAAPDTRGPTVGYHRPADGETGFPTTHSIQVLIHETLRSETINADTVQLRPIVNGTPGSPLATELWFASNDILSIVPEQPLADNTSYQVSFVAGGVRDAVGNAMQPYAFSFSTGSALSGNQRPVIASLTASPSPASPGTQVRASVAASDPEGDSVQYRFDFGDGSPATDWSANTSASHSYTEQGHYWVSVQARDSRAAVASETTGVAILNPFNGGNPQRVSHMATDSSGRLWVVNPDQSTVSVLSAGGRNLIAQWRVCADPRSVAIDAGNRVWVSCYDADQIVILEADGRRIASIDTGYGSAPFGLVHQRQSDRMLVSFYGSGELALFDAGSFALLDRLSLGPTVRAMALNDAGDRVLVTRFISQGDAGQVWEVAVNSASLSLSRTITLPQQWGEDSRFDGRGLPNYLASVSITPDGTRAFVTAKKDNATRGLYLNGEDLDQDNTVRAMVSQIDLASGLELLQLRRDLDNSEQPSDLQFSPSGDYAFISLQGNNAVLVMDTLKIDAGFTGVSSVISRLGTGLAPQSLLLDPASNELLVHSFLSRQITGFDLGDLLSTGATSFASRERDLVDQETLAPDVLAGKQIFYNAADERMSGEGYMACSTCHIDGGHDGRSWDFTGRGEGVRNTPSLHGRAGTGHGLIHWSANFDEIQDFENDIRLAFGGSGFLTEPQFNQTHDTLGSPKAGLSTELDQLAAYVVSLDAGTIPRSPQRSADGAMTPAAVRGSQVFSSSGCDNCHRGPELVQRTDASVQLEDLGTLGTASGGRLGGSLDGIDVPTLNGIWATPSYLHDGSQASLELLLLATGEVALQAEAASISGASEVRGANHWSIDNLAVVRGGEFVSMENGAQVSFSLNADSAGEATATLRYHANYGAADLSVTVNGSQQSLSAPLTLAGDWMFRQWGETSFPVTLASGSNTIVVAKNSGGTFALDEIRISDTNTQISRSAPHSVAADLAPGDFDDLMAYLQQLDARPVQALALSITSPGPDQDVSASLTVTGTAGSGVDQVQVALANQPFVSATGSASWSATLDASGLATGWQIITVRALDRVNGTWVERQQQVNLGGSGLPEQIFGNGFE